MHLFLIYLIATIYELVSTNTCLFMRCLIESGSIDLLIGCRVLCEVYDELLAVNHFKKLENRFQERTKLAFEVTNLLF